MSKILYAETVDGGNLPTRANPEDAGWDLYANHPIAIGVLGANKPTLIRTGCKVEIPVGHFGLVTGRSSSSAVGICIWPSVIDSGYTGELCALATSMRPTIIQRGNRVAQLIIVPIPDFVLVEGPIPKDTLRGDNGWGSSGK